MSIDLNDHPIDEKLLKLFSAEEYDLCINRCRLILTEDRLHLQALLYMAQISLEKRDYNDCLQYCDTVLQEVEEHLVYVWYWRGQALCLLRKYDDGIDSFKRALWYNPENIHAWSQIAVTLFQQGKKDFAMLFLDTVEEKHNLIGKFSMARGFIERAGGNTDEAFIHFLQGGMAVDLNSKDYEENRDAYFKEIRRTLN